MNHQFPTSESTHIFLEAIIEYGLTRFSHSDPPSLFVILTNHSNGLFDHVSLLFQLLMKKKVADIFAKEFLLNFTVDNILNYPDLVPTPWLNVNLEHPVITAEKVRCVLKDLKPSSSSGPDQASPATTTEKVR
ncbi:hypothetical protein JTB14_004584 [Gonioctena quinquepunctata]|nr:hypothetical protein JTB14_004584 [Gonioctena quinquepunctata]